MIRKSIQAIFLIVFAVIIVLPVANMNLKHNQKSEIDNRMLNELPNLQDISNGFRHKLERGLNDRIGFRNEMILSYQEINDSLFGLMLHPSYMYGKNGYVYFRGMDYVRGYQNIYDQQHVKDAAQYIKKLSAYLASRNIDFVYFLIPDKKTVYPEYFPDGINKLDKTPLMTFLLSHVKELGVNALTPLNTFLKIKDDVQLYNVQYDAGHWNANGALVGISMLIDRIHEKYPEVPPLEKAKYEYSEKKMTSLLVSEYRIDENVPMYTLKKEYNHSSIDNDIRKEVVCQKGRTCIMYNNNLPPNNLTALIFHDSYFDNGMYHRFFTESFAKTIFIHSNDLYRIAYYLNIFSPDIVILENVERVVCVDSMLFGKNNMVNTYFPSIDISQLTLDTSFSFSINEIKVSKGNKLSVLNGRIIATDDMHKAHVTSISADINGTLYPTQVNADGNFSITLPNQLLSGMSKVNFIPINDKEQIRYEIMPLELPVSTSM